MELRYFILRRLLLLIPTILGIILIVFILMRAVPNSVLEAPYVNPNSPIPITEQMAAIGNQLGLQYPFPVQFLYYVSNLAHGNWGMMQSPFYTGPVLTGVEYFFPNTLQLALFTVLLSGLISIPLGTYIGNRRDKLADQVGRIFSLSGFAMPIFWLAILVQIGFGKGILTGNPLGVLPYDGAFSQSALPNPLPIWLLGNNSSVLISQPTHMIFFDALIHGDFVLAFNSFSHLILPVITLTYAILAGLTRFVRAGVVDAANQEYVKTARAMGIPERKILVDHIRRNALIPAITVFGLLFAGLIGGVVVVEDIFAYPGMGLLTINSVINYQIYGVMGTTLMFAFFLVTANFIVDIIYGLIDPRIRY